MCTAGAARTFPPRPGRYVHRGGLHLRHGTTTLVASLVTGPADLIRQVGELADEVRAGVIAGSSGRSWLSTQRCGAHQPSLMRDPDPAELDRVLAVGDGAIRMVTLAPERRSAGGGPPNRRRGCGGRGRPHRGDLRTDTGGDHGGRDSGDAPVQRDAPDPPPLPGPVIALPTIPG